MLCDHGVGFARKQGEAVEELFPIGVFTFLKFSAFLRTRGFIELNRCVVYRPQDWIVLPVIFLKDSEDAI